jgi:tetrapyrrole methylase family protein/MazG family protein
LRADDRVEVATVPALSFLDLAWDRLGIDPLAVAVRLIDAEQLVSRANPGPGPFLVAQCWSQALLSGIKLMVDTDEEAALPQVTILHHLGLDDEEVRTVRWWDLDREMTPDHLTSLYINPRKVHPNAQGEMARLEELVRTLRAECPWDRVQTHSSLLPHLVEECYEVLDALSVVASDTPQAGPTEFAHLEEELGDLLFQIVFHARLAEEKGHFTLADVAHGVHEKLVHRHPHVFSDVSADTPDQVVSNWEAIKKEEKGRSSVTEGIPTHLPSLMLTSKLQRKAHSVELSGSERRGELVHLVTKLQDQTQTGDHADTDAPLAGRGETEELVGQLLFDIVDLARRAGVDAEQALLARAMEYRERIVAAETARTPRV